MSSFNTYFIVAEVMQEHYALIYYCKYIYKIYTDHLVIILASVCHTKYEG